MLPPATLVFLIGIHGVTWLKSVTWWGQLYHYDFVEIGTSNYHTFTQARLNHTFQYMCESFKRPWRAILSCRCDKLQICLKAFEVGLLIFGLLPKRRVQRCFLRCIVWNVFSMMFSWCYFIQHSITYFLITSAYTWYLFRIPRSASQLLVVLWALTAPGNHAKPGGCWITSQLQAMCLQVPWMDILIASCVLSADRCMQKTYCNIPYMATWWFMASN